MGAKVILGKEQELFISKTLNTMIKFIVCWLNNKFMFKNDDFDTLGRAIVNDPFCLSTVYLLQAIM